MSEAESSTYQLDWDSKYEIGHGRIDFEHQIFLGLIHKLAECERSNPNAFDRYLLELGKYAEFHFISEENIMLDCDYPDFEKHKSQHQNLLSKLANYVEEIKIQKLARGEFIAFLYEWFINHTMLEDMKISKFIRSDLSSLSD